jgi:CheY-like chemotaxis protein
MLDMALQSHDPITAIRVMVADDDEDMLSLVADTLLVVADVMMPRISGLGVLEALRHARLHFPVVLMTVLADDSVRTVASRLGAVGVLRKPFDVDDLRTAVMNAVLVYARTGASRW